MYIFDVSFMLYDNTRLYGNIFFIRAERYIYMNDRIFDFLCRIVDINGIEHQLKSWKK